MRILWSLVLLFLCASVASAEDSNDSITNKLQITQVTVGGKPVSWRNGELRLPPSPDNVVVYFEPATSNWVPSRLRYKLEGYDPAWRRGTSEMTVRIRFYNESRDIVNEKVFSAVGDSTGWNGSLKTPNLTHRRETVIVPPGATRLMAIVSSAGPQSAIGVYVVDDFTVTRISATNNSPHFLIRTLFDNSKSESENEAPKDWMVDGDHPSMSKVVELGQDLKTKALAIIDDDEIGHAEWHTRIESSRRITPGEKLVLEWNELFSVGVADTRWVTYPKLGPGNYRFTVEEATVFGVPTGVTASLAIQVALPLWKQSWFWVALVSILIGATAAGARYRASYKLRREVMRLKQQRELEKERLRIAQDIHDDLGARVTQISMLSAMAPSHASFPQNAREDFERISSMSRQLVSALYETVWAVNPENDTLYAVGNYLRQTTSQLCEPAQLRCRLYIPPLPHEVQVSSQTRHSISMAVKEAVHNAIKHAKASELTVRVGFDDMSLTITIQDDGRGFQDAGQLGGNGLANMKRRLESIGGTCVVESKPGQGTLVRLTLTIQPMKQNAPK